MKSLKSNDFISGVCTQSKSSRYDYNKINVDSTSISVGSEGIYKESR
ncbi:hypothetical protein [Clostridium cylindrosporum]|uniref:Uncharacterized protein n=1 Tax=Clostridium cylindrosporum DSM 605 TaxID=1121307 RepID=A0A0J8G4H8_CLOCY|nr:hypothetical protein [Clostridium cylindrosporum]KMT22576.1 hypothetical protein CLCY_9c00070 [Clostridium cylindrosporum DSM 605]